MKTLLITGDYPPSVSGISTFFYYVWKYLPAQDFIILAPWVSGCREFDKKENFKIYRGRFLLGKNWISKIRKTLFFLIYTPYIIRKERIGALICAHPMSSGFIGLVFKKLLSMPYYLYVWGGESKKYEKSVIATKFLNLIVKNANILIVDSDYTIDEYVKLRANKQGIIKISPGVDIQKFRPGLDSSVIRNRFKLEGRKVILTVARLSERKGNDTVIKTLSKVMLEVPNLAYLIVGDGDQREQLRYLVKKNKLESNVIFVGEVAHDDTPLYYNACDLYVMPNRETKGEETVEGFGISFIEASACAKAVVGGISGGVKDAVVDKKTGLLVDGQNIELVAETIINLLKNDAYSKELGKNGRERVEREFSWEYRAKAIQDILYKPST
jgi:phosphatidylinositol alpha-1,6-mannosyltransferase